MRNESRDQMAGVKATEPTTKTLIQGTFKLFYKKNHRDLTKTYIFACQHILRPREKVLPLFVKFGIPKSNIFVLGKAYSTNETVLSELRADGFQIFYIPLHKDKSFDEQHTSNCQKL